MHENETTIYQWAKETFGEPKNNCQIAERAREELDELIDLLSNDFNDPKAVDEIADVVIVLSQIVARHGMSLQEAVDRKMQINRARKWKTDGNGVGQHIEEGVR